MKRSIVLVWILSFFSVLCAAQVPARVTFTASNVLDSGGSAPLASGKLCFVTTDANDKPMGYRVGASSGQTSASPDQAPCATVINGAIAPVQIINSGASSPLNACVRVVTKDANNVEIRRSPCVQTGTSLAMSTWCSQSGYVVTCNWDQYPIGTKPVSVVSTGPPGPQGPPGCRMGDTCTAATLAVTQPESGAVSTTLQSFLQKIPVTPDEYGALHAPGVDDFAAIQRACNTGRPVVFSGASGTYHTATSGTLNCNSFSVQFGAKIAPAAGTTLTFSSTPTDGIWQMFDTADGGTIQFSNLPTVRPEWWGACTPVDILVMPTVDCTAAIRNAYLSLAPSGYDATWTGQVDRNGTVLFQPLRYGITQSLYPTYGTKFTAGDTTNLNGFAVIDMLAGSYPVKPANGTAPKFAVFFDPPATTPGYPGNTSPFATNKAFGSGIHNVRVWVEGNSESSITNYVSGLFFPMSQGAGTDNSGAQGGWQYTCAFLGANASNNKTSDICGTTLNGPGVALVGTQTFDYLDISTTNASGLLGQLDTRVPFSIGAAVSVPVQGGCVPGETYVQVTAAYTGPQNAAYPNVPIFPWLKATTGTPGMGQFKENCTGSTLTVQFDAADIGDEGLYVRIHYKDTARILASIAPGAVTPVPGLQVEASAFVHVGQYFSEGNYAALNMNNAQGISIQQLQANPGNWPGAAAVYVDRGSAWVFLPKQEYLNVLGSQYWTYAIADARNSVLKAATLAPNSSFASTAYSPGYVTTLSDITPASISARSLPATGLYAEFAAAPGSTTLAATGYDTVASFGTPSPVAGTATSPAGIQYSSSTAANSVAGAISAGNMRWTQSPTHQSRLYAGSLAGSYVWVGLTDLTDASLGNALATNNTYAADILGFRYVPGTDTNWQCWASNGSTSTAVDSGVAVSNFTPQTLMVTLSPGGSPTFFINRVQVCSGYAPIAVPFTATAPVRSFALVDTALTGAVSTLTLAPTLYEEWIAP